MSDRSIVLERFLRRLLPARWDVEVMARRGRLEAVFLIPPAGSSRCLEIVEILGTTGEVEAVLGRPDRREVLTYAPWLRQEDCERLADRGVNYADLSGNARIVIDDPAVFISRIGALEPPEHDSFLQRRGAVRLMRYLVDHAPKEPVRVIAEATGLSRPYVSQLLKALEQRGMVRRGAQGRVENVVLDWTLIQLAESYDPEAFNDGYSFVASGGIPPVLERLPALGPRVVLTGAVAARDVVDAAPAETIVAYTDDPLGVAAELGLDRTRGPGNVLFLQPFEAFLVGNVWGSSGLWHAAVPQVTVDCLNGPDRRLGECMLDWTIEHVEDWRSPMWSPGGVFPPG